MSHTSPTDLFHAEFELLPWSEDPFLNNRMINKTSNSSSSSTTTSTQLTNTILAGSHHSELMSSTCTSIESSRVQITALSSFPSSSENPLLSFPIADQLPQRPLYSPPLDKPWIDTASSTSGITNFQHEMEQIQRQMILQGHVNHFFHDPNNNNPQRLQYQHHQQQQYHQLQQQQLQYNHLQEQQQQYFQQQLQQQQQQQNDQKTSDSSFGQHFNSASPSPSHNPTGASAFADLGFWHNTTPSTGSLGAPLPLPLLGQQQQQQGNNSHSTSDRDSPPSCFVSPHTSPQSSPDKELDIKMTNETPDAIKKPKKVAIRSKPKAAATTTPKPKTSTAATTREGRPPTKIRWTNMTADLAADRRNLPRKPRAPKPKPDPGLSAPPSVLTFSSAPSPLPSPSPSPSASSCSSSSSSAAPSSMAEPVTPSNPFFAAIKFDSFTQ